MNARIMPKNRGSIFYKIPPYKPLLNTSSILTEKNIFINIQISKKIKIAPLFYSHKPTKIKAKGGMKYEKNYFNYIYGNDFKF